jgi:cytochrome c oxidase cbb3-type subunit IV
MTYDAMRHFADTWVLVVLAAIFLGAVGFALRPGSRTTYDRLSRLPLDDDRKA